jgi:hypothetical protein
VTIGATATFEIMRYMCDLQEINIKFNMFSLFAYIEWK